MKTIASFLGIVLAVILALAIGSGLLVLTAYGVGWAVSRITGFEIFQSTALGLAGILVFAFLFDRISNMFMSTPPFHYSDDDDEYDDDDDEFDDEYDEELHRADQEELDKIYAAIPRWRRPTKNLDFSNVSPDDRCPCGSGRKYKNCHGKQKSR